MKYRQWILVIIGSCFLSVLCFCGERTLPVDIVLMIDKSKSMNEAGKFDSVHKWVRNTFISEMLIKGDWLSIWEFYAKPHELLTCTIQGEHERNAIIRTIDSIRPDGSFTDIGKALDAIKLSLKARGKNKRHKILLLITDLEHDAPWTSKYSGKQESFQSPYLAEARIIRHDQWFEITLDMDIQDDVVKMTKMLYSEIVKKSNQEVLKTVK